MGNYIGQMIDNYRQLLLIGRSGFAFIHSGDLINFDDKLVSLMYKHNSSGMVIYYMTLLLVYLTNKSNFLETLAYMAPGQLKGKAYPVRERYSPAQDPTNRYPNISMLAIARQNALEHCQEVKAQ
jgi:hypothetical protein